MCIDTVNAYNTECSLIFQLGDGSGTATPAPPPPPKLPPCCFCRKHEPKGTMARCKTCSFSVHAGGLHSANLSLRSADAPGCYGIKSQDLGPDWECELCANVRLEEAHLVSPLRRVSQIGRADCVASAMCPVSPGHVCIIDQSEETSSRRFRYLVMHEAD